MPETPPATDKPVLQTKKKERSAGVRPLGEDGEPKRAPLLGGVRLEESVTIGEPIERVYGFWRDLTNLPLFCKYPKEVQILEEGRSRWTAEGPAGKDLQWEAQLIDDRTNELISWRSYEGSDFMNAGSVRSSPAPGRRGTEVHMTFSYNPPGGPLGSIVAKMAAKDPAFLLKEQLRRLKQLLETGEIATTDGQPVVEDK